MRSQVKEVALLVVELLENIGDTLDDDELDFESRVLVARMKIALGAAAIRGAIDDEV